MLKVRKRRLALERSLKERKVLFRLPVVALDCVNTDADTWGHKNHRVRFKSPSCPVYRHATEIRDETSPLQVRSHSFGRVGCGGWGGG